ncbi:MAG: SUMF1/EgtB/PvdO family nonheme iron enzyme [Phycisphaerales bacterium]|nr:MAG: SUMF1/EgtB/PvdO family nonheme iron enzyme [Phycisphaerales bacterium]
MFRVTSALVTLAGIFAWSINVRAGVVIETVTVRNPGNSGELSGACVPGGEGPCRECGAVDYVYNLGKFQVTAGQYSEFLNAVAATDPHGLYNIDMWGIEAGCKIQRTGSSGSYSYSVAPDWADRPVNYVSWADAARFCNWLHNGRPDGAQDLTTTEDGSYYLGPLMAVAREPDATWVIPSEDEWYKAAYHYNDGVTGNYYDYPTSSDSLPSNDLVEPTDPGNNATFYITAGGDWTIGSPYYRTVVGAHENSDSPYGTFDQGGNLWEWNEAVLNGSSLRGIRGGSFANADTTLHAANREGDFPDSNFADLGFRVAQVPEPVTLSLLAVGAILLAKRRQPSTV